MTVGSRTGVDAVTFEVVLHRLNDITEEMGVKYMRTSGSPILVGAYDAATAITLPDGGLAAMGPFITTQGNVLPIIIMETLRRCATNPGIRPGDMFICSDPYLGATHVPDVATVSPIYHRGELVAWCGASGHWLDIGGPEPGSFNMNARTIYDEGLRMPPMRIVEQGCVREDLVALIMNQVREPLVELDLRGQFVANTAGQARMTDLFNEFGVETVQAIMREAISYTERRIRARLKSLPDGVWREIQFLDQDGHSRTIHKIVCTVSKEDDRLTVDFSGTDPQAAGYVNCTWSGVRAATLSAMYILLAYDLPWNDGVARCLELHAPPGTLVAAQHPAPVSMSTISSIILALSAVFAALAKMLSTSADLHDEAMANWCATSMAPGVSGLNDRGMFTFLGESSHFGAGCGARSYADGVDTGGIIINTTASMPSIEATEAEFPVLYLFRRQVTDSGGPGRFRGGLSAGIAWMPYHATNLESTFAACGVEIPNSFGLAGGMPGAAVRYFRYLDTSNLSGLAQMTGLPTDLDEIDGQREITFTSRSHAAFPGDSVEYHNWQGGGGFGDPVERDLAAVEADVLNRRVSEDCARTIYGVILREGAMDALASEKYRDEMRRSRIERAQPASDVSGLRPPLVARTSSSNSGGSLTYAGVVKFDFDRDEASCTRCGRVLARSAEDFRLGCLVIAEPVSAAGPGRGEDYDLGRVKLLLYICPGCGRVFESAVTVKDAMSSGFVLAPRASAEPKKAAT